jgi:predicted amidohydrolase YtcJ
MKRKISIPILMGVCLAASQTDGESISLQDIANAAAPLPKITIYSAREIVTLDPNKPRATAVAVVGNRILATGALDELKMAAGDQSYKVDSTFADKVIIPGLICQHDHPFLAALTMMSHIIAIEDWVLPSGTVPAAKTPQEYHQRLVSAHRELKDPNELLLTWGYHQNFHGKLSRADLDKISMTRPIIVWHRSVHEMIVNTKALETYGVTKDVIATWPKGAQKQSNFEDGHFWEQGIFAVAPKLLPAIAANGRIQRGLEFVVNYYHANGVTAACEPGGLYSKHMQDEVNAVLSKHENPFRFYFIPDGKSIYATFPNTTILETEKTLNWCHDMTVMLPQQIKLFADGAIFSQLMQLRDPYLDGHHGEWIMEPQDFATAFRIYWDAGYQIHVHETGDKGLDMVLDNVEANMRRNPRYDHRTVAVHFAVSQKDQIQRIKRLGVIVSGNPYYVRALADNYSVKGLGPQRADNMVRFGDVERAGISYSYHADMPVAPGQPLFLIDCAVNRTTVSGRVAAKNQRASREGSLRAVTLDAAYSLRLENEMGNIVPGKLANFTILADNPLTVPAAQIKNISIWGTVQEGRILPVQRQIVQHSAIGPMPNSATYQAMDLDMLFHECEGSAHTDICMLNKIFAAALL